MPERTDEQLRKTAKHVRYEHDMFVAISQFKTDESTPIVVWNALLESFALHFRSLDEFFFSHRSDQHKDDARAADYVLVWAPPNDLRADVKDQIEAINKRVAHLTYLRDLYPSEWPVSKMWKAEALTWKAFIAALPPTRRPWFKEPEAPGVRQFDEHGWPMKDAEPDPTPFFLGPVSSATTFPLEDGGAAFFP